MTQAEAQAEAERRWGADAIAKINNDQLHIVGERIDQRLEGWNTKKWGPLTRDHGWGSTWEEAFTLADIRTWSYEDLHPSQHTAETGQEVSQMRLFP